jgi:hypothetical protein
MSLLDAEDYDPGRIVLPDFEEIDEVYNSWHKTEGEFMELRRRNEVRNRMVTSLEKLNRDMKIITACENGFSKRRNTINNCYFNGLKIVTFVSANLVAYYWFFY